MPHKSDYDRLLSIVDGVTMSRGSCQMGDGTTARCYIASCDFGDEKRACSGETPEDAVHELCGFVTRSLEARRTAAILQREKSQ